MSPAVVLLPIASLGALLFWATRGSASASSIPASSSSSSAPLSNVASAPAVVQATQELQQAVNAAAVAQQAAKEAAGTPAEPAAAQQAAVTKEVVREKAKQVQQKTQAEVVKVVDPLSRIRAAALELRKYLLDTPTIAAFGTVGMPSPAVAAFQKIAGLTPDGIMGNATRKAAADAGVTFPKRPAAPAAPAALAVVRPAVAAPATAAPPPAAAPVVVQPVMKPAAKPATVVAPQVAPTPAAALSPAPQPSAAPVGYDPALARTLAPRVEQELRTKKYGYSKPLLAQFQRAAGIAPDGVYGGGARGALVFYGQPRAPGPFFKPLQTVAYRPPA